MEREVKIRGDMIRLGQLLKLAGLIDAGGEAAAYLDSEYTRSAAERERIFGLLLQERDQILSLGPKYRQMVRDEPALMELLERAAAKHDEAVDRGEAEPFTRKGLTS